MTRRRDVVADIRDAVLLRERDGLRAELVKLGRGFSGVLSARARTTAPRWMTDMDARHATRIAAILRRLGTVQEKLWRRREGANA